MSPPSTPGTLPADASCHQSCPKPQCPLVPAVPQGPPSSDSGSESLTGTQPPSLPPLSGLTSSSSATTAHPVPSELAAHRALSCLGHTQLPGPAPILDKPVGPSGISFPVISPKSVCASAPGLTSLCSPVVPLSYKGKFNWGQGTRLSGPASHIQRPAHSLVPRRFHCTVAG